MIERIESPAPAELEALTDLWERSVRATHDFLAPKDIAFFRRMVREEALPGVEELHVIRDEKNGFAAFAGVEAGKLEMLFVAPEKRGRGLGRELVEYLVARRDVRRVDVNEQNAQAALSVADRAYVLETGRITLSGTGKELMASDAVRKAYLGG